MSAFLRTVTRAAVRPSTRAFSATPSNNVARITIIGNLGASPELKPTSTGRDMIKYNIASRSRTGETHWFQVVSFAEEGRFRDYLLSLPKGALVHVEGDVSTGSYNSEDGNKKFFFNIVQRSFDVLRRGQGEEGQPAEEGQAHE